MTEGEIVRMHLRFVGRVQGVGFRWRTRQIAAELGLTGWVENMWDGAVEMELQGTEDRIYRLINTLYKSAYININDFDIKQMPVIPSENRFSVRGY